MNLSTTLSSAMTGLNAAQASINSASNNIANANTEGYVRKTLSQQSRILQDRGTGVEVGLVERIADEFLIEEARRQASITGKSVALDKFHSLSQDAFGNPSSGQDIGSLVGTLAAALEAFTGDHETPAFAQRLLNSASDLTGTVDRLADQVQRLRGEADKDIERVTDALNADLQTIHALNIEIARVTNAGDTSPDLFDKRDFAVKQLAEKIEIDTYIQDDGIIAVYTAGGQSLVDVTPRVVHYDALGTVAPDSTFAKIAIFREDQIDPATGSPFDPNGGVEIVSSGVRAYASAELSNDGIADADQLIVSTLRSGKIQGLIEMRDEVFPALNDQLQELADGLRFALNQAHNDSVAWPQPNALSGTRTDLSDFAAAPRSGTATIAVTDTSDGSTLLAFNVDLAAVADENGLIGQINTNLGALGTAAIGPDGQLEINLVSAANGLAISEGDSSITITDTAGRDRDYGFSHYFGLNDFVVRNGSLPTNLEVRQTLVADPAKIGTAKLDITTPPLTATLGGIGDNRGALSLMDGLNADYDVLARGSLSAQNIDFGSYAAEITALAASNANQAENQARIDVAVSAAVNFRNDSVSTVNLDEELASLITFQQAYSVAARVISMVDEMLEDLVNMIR